MYLIRANRRLFAELASLSDGRRELAQQLIATRESTLRHISRELHDEVGQILTAMGSMLGRAERQAPDGSPLRGDLREIGEIAQGTLNSVRSLSQTLHPSILEELGLESTIDWYLATVEKQLGLAVSYERTGTVVPVDGDDGIHVYRVLQEALSNVARHSGADRAWVRLRYLPGALELEVEDHGSGLARAHGPARPRAGRHARAGRARRRDDRVRAPTEGGTLVGCAFRSRSRTSRGVERSRLTERPTADGQSTMDKITVLLADDHHLVRRGFRRMLEDDPDLASSAKPATATRRCAWRSASVRVSS